jgi:hypothetical protein
MSGSNVIATHLSRNQTSQRNYFPPPRSATICLLGARSDTDPQRVPTRARVTPPLAHFYHVGHFGDPSYMAALSLVLVCFSGSLQTGLQELLDKDPQLRAQKLMPAFAPEESAEFEAGEAAGVEDEVALGADVTVDNTAVNTTVVTMVRPVGAGLWTR